MSLRTENAIFCNRIVDHSDSMKSDVCISTYLRTHSAAPYVFDSRRPDASQRRHDGISGLRTELNRKKDAARVAEARLMTFFSKLRSVDLPRLKADDSFNLIQEELERLTEHLKQAKVNNVSLNKAIAQHSANLQILST
ncbi:hypothetical protein B9Z55_028165 [Caenorhabditis nigoni]|uniref:Uncharacterized protein n=1 Tax=Caenorhabditis nigoni TaxID=1611254 RepID=A0A2G5SD01_9PELO|nr:hypothetical protein B9Z55_028165 [Caenorhabditis nigoni]